MEPLVTVCCTAYNQEKYITDAIESFLMQKTDFTYEIIIHDDASEDNTANIIKEYEKKFPGIIRPIYQTENQYSKGIKIFDEYIIPNVKTKYIATCEGDDYWTDPLKLQEQVDFLESNDGYSMCFHAVSVVSTEKKFLGRYYGPYGSGDRDYTIKDTVRAAFVHMSSRVVPTRHMRKQRPLWMKNAKHGDYARTLFLCTEGKVHYIDKVMSSYRTGVEGSLMTGIRNGRDKRKKSAYLANRVETLKLAKEFYGKDFEKEINCVILVGETEMLLLNSDFSSKARKKYKDFIAQDGMKSFMKKFLISVFPGFVDLLIKIKMKIS